MSPSPDPNTDLSLATRVNGELIETILPAKLGWNDGQPHSLAFDDIYFSGDGPAEVTRVFHEPVNLASRCKQVADTLSCAELGFGSGLSFARTAQTFCKHSRARLHYISIEAAPFAPPDRERIVDRWGQELPILRDYHAQAPALLSGWHRLLLGNGQICLSLFYGSAEQGLDDLLQRQRRGIDHWLLDGFSPSHNPAMWAPALLHQVGALGVAGGTVATFTAAGQVRRDLGAAGFAMRKVDQAPHKRHSLAGELPANSGRRFEPPPSIDVVGAGIAGASVARALAQRGRQVNVFEPGGRAQGASRIPAASLHGRLLADGSLGGDWQLASFHFSHRALADVAGYRACGIIQRPSPNTTADRIAALIERYGASGDWLRQTNNGDLHYQIGGVVRGPQLCRALLDHPLIQVHPRAADINSANPPLDTPTVLAAGHALRDWLQLDFLELGSMMGQAELCSHPQPPEQPIVHNGYVAPYRTGPHGGIVIGSTYEYRPWRRDEAQVENLARWPDHGRHRGSFRARRAITSDRLPIVGSLRRGTGAPIENLWLSTGYGSTGMTAAPLAGEIIAANICGEIAPISAPLETLLQGTRFHDRQRRRGTRLGAKMDNPT